MRGKATKIILAVIFAFFIVAPLVAMLTKMSASDWRQVFTTANFGAAVRNSLIVAVVASVCSVLLAYSMAFCVERVAIKGKGILRLLFILPMLIPSISNGMGIILLLGNNGFLTNLLHFNFNIYGLPGIVLGEILYATPVAFLMFSDILRYQDASPYEAANVLGLTAPQQFKKITWPYLRKPLVSVIFMVFALVITDYGVPLVVGGKVVTLPVILYTEVVGQLNFGKGVVYGCLLLIPAVIAFVVDLCSRNQSNTTFTTKTFSPSNQLRTKIGAYIFCILVAVLAVAPIVSFAVIALIKNYPRDWSLTFDNLRQAFQLRAGEFWGHSILMSLCVALCGVVIAFITAYLTARTKGKIARILHLTLMMTAAIPGMVLGLAYILTFKNSFLYGTLAILVVVNVIHFIASPYLMMYNSLAKINENLENVGDTLGVSRFNLLKDVFIPQCKHTLLEMFSYFFVNSMMTISAVSFLATYANKPLSLLISQFQDRQIECAAVVSLLILLTNLVLKGLIFGLKKCEHKGERKYD